MMEKIETSHKIKSKLFGLWTLNKKIAKLGSILIYIFFETSDVKLSEFNKIT